MDKILIVSHDEIIQMLYADELSDEGYDVRTLADSNRVLAVIQEERPDLIVIEAESGHYNGLDLIRDIRDKEYELPIIFCIAYPGFACGRRSVEDEFDVVKSSNLCDLTRRVNKALLSTEPLRAGTTLVGNKR